ncbi:MAG: TRAP transporter substrate-binding protein DctP [Ignavibacteriae bacterium]|nr:TRAP transporter substrate-binding protein DctP [Ignavibacteriota bacterium]
MTKLILTILLITSTLFSQQYTIKFATVAPEGSTWINIMKEYDAAVRKESGGKMGFKIFAGGVQGDERDVLRKVKLGQLHSTGITGNGITTIAQKARILDTPFLFKSTAEVDHVLKTFDTDFNKAFNDGGYVLLGWAEVGFVNIYTNTPVSKPEEMKGVKMWMWEGDPVAEATFKALNINPIPLSLTDVMTSLQTKMIDGVYSSPLGLVALQWFTRVKYMFNLPLADASGAVVISKKKFDGLPADMQEILLRNGKKYMTKLTEASRKENAKSIETMKKQGIKIIEPPSKDVISMYDEIGKKARRMLVGKLYDEGFMNRVEQTVSEFRKANNKTSQ